MLALNFCRCRYGNLLNLTSKTNVLRLARKCSDDTTKTENEIEKKTEKVNAKKKTKLYTNTSNEINELQVKAKLNELLNSFEISQSMGYGNNKDIKIPKAKEGRTTKKSEKKMKLDDNIVASAKHVAKDLGGDVKKTEEDLISSLKQFLIDPEEKKTLEKTEVSKPRTISFSQKESAAKVQSIISDISNIELYSSSFDKSERLGIFENHKPEELSNVQLKLWNKLEEEQLKLLTKSPPRNYYEEMIHWTEEGKLWHFPINNEQGMDEEAKYSFTDHVFLEDHLEPWCPKIGPLRHFMELVLVGLSKNPFLTVKQKHEHIYWFRDYFEQKRKLLTEVGAFVPKTITAE